MDQTRPDGMKICRNTGEEFTPIPQLKNPHIQTLLPRILRRIVRIKPYWQRLELPDGDFVDLAWSENPQHAQHKSRAVIFHGLEGSINSPYAHGLLSAFKKRGWLGVVMHFRGCSGESNRKNKTITPGILLTPVISCAGCNKRWDRHRLPPPGFHWAEICWLV